MYKELLEEAVKLNQLPKLTSFVDECVEYSSNKLWDEIGKGNQYIKLERSYLNLIELGFNLPLDCNLSEVFSDLAVEVWQKRVK